MADDANAVNETVETQATTTPESAPEETKELEVVREGEVVEPELYEKSEETEGEEPEVTEEQSEEAEESTEETEAEEKPLGEKGMRRNQRLANENKKLREYIQQLESQQPKIEKYDVREAIEKKGLTLEQARIEALEHNQRTIEQRYAQEQESRALQDLNVAVRADAESVMRDFPDLTANEADTALLVDAWHQVADVQYLTDENGETVVAPDGAPVLKTAKFSLYDFANVIDHFAASRQKQGEAEGQKAAEKNLAAVEVRPTAKPKQSNKDDSQLSADEYAKKYGLSTVR